MSSHERILVVDDEEQMRDLLAKVLERKGFQTSVCGDGTEALAFLETYPTLHQMVSTVSAQLLPGTGIGAPWVIFPDATS